MPQRTWPRSRLLCLPTLLWFLLLPETARGQRNPDDILIGEDANYYYYMTRDRYQGSDAQRFGSQYCRNKQAVAADQRALRGLGFGVDAERLELFAKIGRDQKQELETKLYNALFDASLDATDKALQSAKSLNPWNANSAIHALEGTPLHNSAVASALRWIARQKGKPELAAAYHKYKDAVKQIKEELQAEKDAAKDPDNANLRLLVGTLKIALGEEAGLAVTTAEVSENLVYLGYASAQVNDIARASDEKFVRLADLSKRLKSHVSEMAEAKRAWQKATGYAIATPICR
jgi:hypothetical protein